MNTFLILTIPFFGTALGSATVFFLKNPLPAKLQKPLLGFASGIMIAASVWSLLIPAVELSAGGSLASVLPATGGFLCGTAFLLLTDRLTPHVLQAGDRVFENRSAYAKRAAMLFAVTLHNLPEGMAVGVTCAGTNAPDGVSVAAAFALSIGVAIQNFPEGAIVSLPLHEAGLCRRKAFSLGVLSGAVEPLGGVLILLFASALIPLLPFFLAFAAGAMIYVVADELIPEAKSEDGGCLSTLGVSFGFVTMMFLDVLLK